MGGIEDNIFGPLTRGLSIGTGFNQPDKCEGMMPFGLLL